MMAHSPIVEASAERAACPLGETALKRSDRAARQRAQAQQARRRARHLSRVHPYTLPGIASDEVDAHFRGMPDRYWEQVTEHDLVWDLRTVHSFFAELAASQAAHAPVVVNWRRDPETELTQVRVCTWDRHGLLAKIAAAFSALRINIVRAEAYTRADNLALDAFYVCDQDHRPLADNKLLNGVVFLIEGALLEPPRFASFWAAQFHKALPRSHGTGLRIRFNNARSPFCTLMRVAAPDRLGLLCDILKALSESGMNIAQADIRTQGSTAIDLIHLTDHDGAKVLDRARLRRVRRAVAESILL